MPPLSQREKQFLQLYFQGNSYKEICQLMAVDGKPLSINTAKTHAKSIIVKTMATCLRHAAYVRLAA